MLFYLFEYDKMLSINFDIDVKRDGACRMEDKSVKILYQGAAVRLLKKISFYRQPGNDRDRRRSACVYRPHEEAVLGCKA